MKREQEWEAFETQIQASSSSFSFRDLPNFVSPPSLLTEIKQLDSGAEKPGLVSVEAQGEEELGPFAQMPGHGAVGTQEAVGIRLRPIFVELQIRAPVLCDQSTLS